MSALQLCRACDTYQKARHASVCEKCGSDDLWREPEESEPTNARRTVIDFTKGVLSRVREFIGDDFLYDDRRPEPKARRKGKKVC